MEDLQKEEKHMLRALKAAREVQEFLWGEANGRWGIEEWRRMLRKRIAKIDSIDTDRAHAGVELKKRLLQMAAISIALIHILDKKGVVKPGSSMVSNLPEYKTKIKDQSRREKAEDCCDVCGGKLKEDEENVCGECKNTECDYCDGSPAMKTKYDCLCPDCAVAKREEK